MPDTIEKTTKLQTGHPVLPEHSPQKNNQDNGQFKTFRYGQLSSTLSLERRKKNVTRGRQAVKVINFPVLHWNGTASKMGVGRSLAERRSTSCGAGPRRRPMSERRCKSRPPTSTRAAFLSMPTRISIVTFHLLLILRQLRINICKVNISVLIRI